MKHILIILILVLATSATSFSQPAGKTVINKVIDDIESFQKKEFSDSSEYGPLGSYTEASLLRRYNFYNSIYNTLDSIVLQSLSTDDKINIELLKYIASKEITYYRYKEYMNPILADEGFHTSLPRIALAQYSTKKEYERYIQILKAFPKYVDENLALMRKGLAAGISQPKIALEGYENTYDKHIVADVAQSTFNKPFTNKPSAISSEEWQKIKTEGQAAVMNEAIASYKKIKDFFEKEYYPKTRKTLGASAFPNGKEYYEEKVKQFTTTNLSSTEVYNIGLAEVARIKKEMEDVMREVNYKGTFKEFITFLRSDPRFYVNTADQLLKEASFIAKKIDGKLPLLFGKLPRQPYGVVPVPDYLAPTYTSGRYGGADIHSKNAGSYYVNTYELKSRTLYTLESLTLHEAVPGHHLQISLAQELDNLPKFRRNMYISAFGEGWGLYGEYLGYELGLYKDPYSRFGRLTYEMWRACRLVIDVGIHTKNWTREQAVSFLADNTALSLHEVNTEINRYITWPGQALAYKIGELKIKELRKRAEEKLKDKFDVRAFHDLVLSQGTVTLSILESMVDDYIEKQLAVNK